MKFLYTTVLVVALASVAFAVNSSWGGRNGTDFLLTRDNVTRAAQYNNYISVTVDFPKSGQVNNAVITAVYVFDRFTNSSGAIANLWSGGPGYKFATINLKSQYSKGINSTVEIWGKY